MQFEVIYYNNVQIRCWLINIQGDGACLFSSLSYLMYENVSISSQIRLEIVGHVSKNWVRFQPFTQDRSGAPYGTKSRYIAEMSRSDTYGTTCELMAASDIYPYKFQVFRDGHLILDLGEVRQGVKMLRFTGYFSAGHFDVLIPMIPLNLTPIALPNQVVNEMESPTYTEEIPLTKIKESPTYTQVSFVPEIKESPIFSEVNTLTEGSSTFINISQSTITPTSEESIPSISKKGKKRRKRFTVAIRNKQLRTASVKYAKHNPDVNREAVKRYAKHNPNVNREAVKRYAIHNPNVNREAVKRYTEKNPDVHRQAVQRYSSSNPHVNEASAARYRERILLPWTNKHNSGFSYDHLTDYCSDKSIKFGPRIPCTWCRALKWRDEPAGLCCNGGKVQLDPLEPYPEPLHSLLTDLHPLSEHFLSSVRNYNGCFQMTSFGAKEVREGNFMPTFKVQGQVYHRIGSLLAEPQQQPSFLQIYFVGEHERESDIRCGIYPGVKPGLVSQLQSMLHCHNKYILDFKAAVESIPAGQEDFHIIINADKKPHGEHQGRFNVPAVREVAVLIVGQEFEKRDIVLHSRNNRLIRISEIHRAYDTLQYPLMFCRGEDGYCSNILQRNPNTKALLSKTVSAVDFYSFKIMERDEECYLLRFRNLLNQYLVDMYAKIESERLNFIRYNQKKLRSEEYVHLKDAMSRSDCQLTEVGKIVILPSSFTGGPRYMHERTQDAMTYVRHYGRPDLFITFTCNPKWPEITENLKKGQKPQDRHDLVARVFHLKVKQLMKLLTKGSIFGATKCHMHSIEWQKRGLPHVHILLWLEEKIRPESIDKVILAEIPDFNHDPVLHDIVKTTMIHGPCGAINRNSPCMKDGSCAKKYPKPFLKETESGEDGYPQYRRRSPGDNGFTANIRGVDIDNRWVVPYNPVLLRTFSAHINVEYCNSVKSIKYICKYINKGSDQAAFTVEDFDEVTKYETGRYISSSEAVWRILCFPIHERFPPVIHLAVHLENGQRVYFTEDSVVDRINHPPKTTLMGFFDLCQVDEFAKTLLYCEVPCFYTWNNNKFSRRKKGKPVSGFPGVKKEQVLGRVYNVHPNNGECYFLRILLLEVRGPTSFADLKTVNGVVQPTYQAACRVRGLLEDDAHWNRTLEEASLSESPKKIRQLFAIMLIFCQISDPLSLWENHKASLSEDIKRQIEREHGDIQSDLSEIVNNRCLIFLEDIIMAMSDKSLTDLGLPAPSREQNSLTVNRLFLSELSYNPYELTEVVYENVPKLNTEQRGVYNEIMHSVEQDMGHLFFLDAPGGTGKTFLINLLLATIRRSKKIAIAVASSGIAATLLDGGKTAHSAFKLPLNLNCCESPICNISKQSDIAKVLREAKIIIWDECTMAHKGGIEALNRSLQDIKDCRSIMGGVTVLLAGDFRQTLPVVSRGTRADEVKACLKSSFLWPHFKVLKLRVNMRVHLYRDLDADTFSKLLLEIGNGSIEEIDGRIIIPSSLCTIVSDLNSLTNKIYPNLNQTVDLIDTTWLRERAILTTTNDSVNSINNFLLQKLPSSLVKYQSVDQVLETDDAVHYPVEFLHSLDPPGLPPHELLLKVGAPIMLLRNLQPPKLCNGTRLLIKKLQSNIIEATIFTGVGQGETVFIPRIPLIPSDYQINFKRIQFPVKVAYAMTINKAQGQSLRAAGVDLRSDCFSHGQLYVACSRVSSQNSLFILQPDNMTRNVVYREVLDDRD